MDPFVKIMCAWKQVFRSHSGSSSVTVHVCVDDADHEWDHVLESADADEPVERQTFARFEALEVQMRGLPGAEGLCVPAPRWGAMVAMRCLMDIADRADDTDDTDDTCDTPWLTWAHVSQLLGGEDAEVWNSRRQACMLRFKEAAGRYPSGMEEVVMLINGIP